jgi:hypothetical protein
MKYWNGGILEYWNNGQKFKEQKGTALLLSDPSFHHSNIPLFQTGNLTENMLAYPPLRML